MLKGLEDCMESIKLANDFEKDVPEVWYIRLFDESIWMRVIGSEGS